MGGATNPINTHIIVYCSAKLSTNVLWVTWQCLSNTILIFHTVCWLQRWTDTVLGRLPILMKTYASRSAIFRFNLRFLKGSVWFFLVFYPCGFPKKTVKNTQHPLYTGYRHTPWEFAALPIHFGDPLIRLTSQLVHSPAINTHAEFDVGQSIYAHLYLYSIPRILYT